jgi:DNA polymerase-3 subunit delta'
MRFSEIFGQKDIKNKLISTVKNNRVSHAQLFLGPEGSSKLSMAIAYAQYISCKNKIEFESNSELIGDSCGTCPSCQKYNNLAHPDLHFFYPITATKEVKTKPKSSDFAIQWRELLIKNKCLITLPEWYEAIGVENKQGIINTDDCNDLISRLNYKSYESEYKVVIIWMIEKIYHAAAPKLLKNLEEPPDKTLFLLISQTHDQILNTILSRTQLVKFKKYKDEEIIKELTRKYECSQTQARKIAGMAEGNLKMAIDLLLNTDDDNFNFINMRKWLLSCYFNKIQELITFVDEISSIGREKQKHFLSYGLFVLRFCLLVNYENEDMLNLDEEEKTFIIKLSKIITPDHCNIISGEFNKAIFHIERNASPKILFMDLSLKLAKLIKK